jgi:hypothetical protein
MVLGLFQSLGARSSRRGAGFPACEARALRRLTREQPKVNSCVSKRYIPANSVRPTQRFGARTNWRIRRLQARI